MEQPVTVVDPEACASEKDTGSERPTGKTGLHLAAIRDSREIAELLVAKDCRLDIQDAEVHTHIYKVHHSVTPITHAISEVCW